MTNTYLTGNPLGSKAPKDLYDNASNFDDAMNSTSPSFDDRFGKRRQTWAGAEYEWQQIMQNSFYEPVHLTYVDGAPLVVSRPTQLIDRAGSVYRVKTPANFPFTLTGTWATDQNLLVEVADAALRSQLAASSGATMIGVSGYPNLQVNLDALKNSGDGINVKQFGALGDGVADDTAAIQAAFASLPNGSGKLVFPRGIYNYTQLNFDGAIGLTLEGDGAINTSILRCTSTLAGDGVKIRSSFDCTASFLHFDHATAGFTGYLVDVQHKPSSAIDTQGMFFFRCTFASQSYDKYAAKGVNLDQATLVTFLGCKFVSLLRPIDGQNPVGGSYSNGMRFVFCQFADNVGYAFNYLGEQWTFQDCNFQACRDGSQRIAFCDSSTPFQSLNFIDCGVYDAVAAESSYLNLGPGTGLTVTGGMWGGRSDLGSSTFLNATGAIKGVSIKGSRFSLFTNWVVAGAAGSEAWDLSGGNVLISVSNYVAGLTNVTGISTDLNSPNISIGTLPSTSGAFSRRVNQDNTVDMTGAQASVASGSIVTITFPTAFATACWDVQVTLQAPGNTGNVISLAAAPTTTGFSVFISGSGTSTVRWRAIGK